LPGNVHFRIDGQDYTPAVLGEADDESWFTIFADETNGDETYGAGRFIYVQNQGNGRAVIGFNKAYNPPCLFTPYATSPLPPSRNHHIVRIEAGEKADS
jgi:uncharacterized protein (DUF1684 family)